VTTTTLVPVVDDLDDLVTDWVQTEEVVGAVAMVAAPERASSVGIAGWSDREATEPISRETGFRIGSITKVFTAALVLDLVEDGLLGLYDPVAAYVEGVHPDTTIEHLLSHTSGLSDIDVVEGIRAAIADPSSVPTPDAVVRQTLERGAESDPGTHQSYSSVNYLVLQGVVEAVTGASYESALRERVLGPLGLADTQLERDETDTATPYERPIPGQSPFSLKDLPTGAFVRAAGAAGALVSTGDDVVTFTEGLFGGRVISPATLDQMIDGTTEPRSGYGLGIATYQVGTTPVYGHNGRSVGFASSVRHDPLSGVTVVVLTNDGDAPTDEFADDLIRRALEE
jgi:CubicO group peptidase (beta-lactamase class C family)